MADGVSSEESFFMGLFRNRRARNSRKFRKMLGKKNLSCSFCKHRNHPVFFCTFCFHFLLIPVFLCAVCPPFSIARLFCALCFPFSSSLFLCRLSSIFYRVISCALCSCRRRRRCHASTPWARGKERNA